MTPQPFARTKATLITGGVMAYIGLAVAGTLYGSAALYPLMHKQRPQQITARSTLAYWDAYAGEPQERKKLLVAIGLPALALFVIVPAALASAGRRRRELHGSARFATATEVRKAGLSGDKGILLGTFQGKYLMLPGQQSVLLSAPMRAGKGVAFIVPNLLAWPDSACVLDIKAENFTLTAGYRAAHAQAVHTWAPFAQDGRSHRWNPLSYVRPDPRFVIGDILAIAQVLYPTDLRGSGTEAFFNDQARNLFLGLALVLVETPGRRRTVGELLRESSGKGRPINEHLRATIDARTVSSRPLSETCVDALMRFLSTSENTMSSILATLNAPLTVFADPFVDAATSGDDFSLLNLRRKRTTVYLCIPPNRLADASVLLNLFFSQLINLNTDQLPQHNPELKFQCLLVLDEMAAMGRVQVLAKSIGYLAGYGLRVLSVIQAVSQLESVYGDKDARTFVTNHAAQILFAPREQRDANEYSEMLGTFTEKSESRGRSHSHGAKSGGGSSTSSNVSPQRRALLLPQEFKELGVTREVVLIENTKPILADKICYYTDPVFTARLLPPPVLPEIHLERHIAHTRPRIPAKADAAPMSFDEIAIDTEQLPTLTEDADAAALAGFVEAFFRQLQFEDLASAPLEEREPCRA